MEGMKGIVDFIKGKKFKKTADYEITLNKLLDKAKKAKPGKTRFEVRTECKDLKFSPVGKKATPVNELDICRIKNLKKTSISERAIAFTYPGPDGKYPLMLYTMRFEKEGDYTLFVERIENTSCQVCDESKSNAGSSHHSASRSSSSSLRHSTSHSSRRKEKRKKINCYISSDNILSPYGRSNFGGNCFDIGYQSSSPYRRAYSVGPQNVRIYKVYRVEKGSSMGSGSSSSSSSTTSICADFTSSSSYSSDEFDCYGESNAYFNSYGSYYKC
nr:hypothetical transcript [Hymenolepis microstoma]